MAKRRHRYKRRRLKLQKIDDDTNKIIDLFRDYLFSIGVRSSRERAWDILQNANRLPFEYLIHKNKGGIKYQGQGRHISSKHGDQLLVIKELGRYEVKAISNRSKTDKGYNATIKFKPSLDLLNKAREEILVVEDEEN